ncbi:MAG: tetratricopeptide repeat protein [Deltaproteobacteria bacterium]|nr:tetratricopeptide repeat protein [Deltaproteobacteria bacterium]
MEAKNTKIEGYVKSQTVVILVILALAVGFVGGIALTIYKLDAETSFSRQHSQQNKPGDRDGMLAALEKEVKRNPQNADAWVQLGHLYFDRDEYKKAIFAYEKSLELAPDNTNVLTDLGIMYRRSGNPRKAVELFDRVIAIDPQEQNARFNKGVVLLHDLKDKAGAIAAWEGLLEINPVAMAPNGQSVDELIQQYK